MTSLNPAAAGVALFMLFPQPMNASNIKVGHRRCNYPISGIPGGDGGSAEQLFNLKQDFGKCNRGNRVPAVKRERYGIAVGGRIPVNQKRITWQILDPDLRDARGSVPGDISIAVVSKRSVGHLNNQKSIFGRSAEH